MYYLNQQINEMNYDIDSRKSVKLKKERSEKEIVFCVDGNKRIGMGHVKRCLALSEQLKENICCDIIYLMKDPDISQQTVLGYGYKTIEELPDKGVDIIITSLPQISDAYMRELKRKTKLLICLDDSGRTQFFADIVIRGSIVPELRGCDSQCDSIFLLGKDYMVLDKQFQQFHDFDRVIRPDVRSILVVMGGSDVNDFTTIVMNALERMGITGVKKTVVVGPAFADVDNIMKRKGFQFKYNVSNMAELMLEADIAVVGGGMILYELACVGTPGIILCQTDYQLLEAKCFEKEGVVVNLGGKEDISEELIKSQLKSLMSNYEKRREMSIFGKNLIDGRAIDKIIKEIKKYFRDE